MFKDYNRENVESNVNEALRKAHKSHELYNDVVTFIDPSQQLANLPSEGKMLGVPIALKDNVCTKDIKTTACSNILNDYVPIYDATIVKKLQQAGAISICKTNMDELAMGGTNLTSNIGACLNPWDPTRMSGGSSGGSAVIVASGAVDFAIGSDTGDSVRKPAAYCGVIGVKPTYGRISRYGIIPYASSLDHVGYFTRSVEDASIALEVLAGRDDLDMTSANAPVDKYHELLNSDLTGKKIAVFKNVYDGLSNPDTKAIFDDLLAKMVAKGAIVEQVSFDEDLLKAILPTYYLIANCEATANHSNLDGIRFGVRKDGKDVEEIMINSRTAGFGSLIRKRFVIGSYGLFVENQEKLFRQAQRVRRLICEEIKKCLDSYDCLIAPASNDVAPKLDDHGRDELSNEYLIVENHMIIGNFTGYPSMTLPMGFRDGCPLGVNITCKAFDEVGMFNIAAGIETITGLKDLKKEGA
ncbi:MAG: aspartyl/glutamyl-tRNA amidotransferase subunit A [Erysipelotrichaceae bacterium]|nr:aspartyl/glutamyl-tRNA amidotransferase subunit A [Erysipelotrichaceae bacterium]MDY5251994.1 amidase family protein [Erysipelotrichaceae bacterium]